MADFTVEFWTKISGSDQTNFFAIGTGTSLTYISSVLQLKLAGSVKSGINITLPLNTWTHIAVARSGTTLKVFTGGVTRQTLTNNSDNISDNSGLLTIGNANTSAVEKNVRGYITNFHLVKGTALYTADYTPSTSIPTPIAGQSVLLMDFFNSASRFLEDISSNPITKTITNSGAVYNKDNPSGPNGNPGSASFGAAAANNKITVSNDGDFAFGAAGASTPTPTPTSTLTPTPNCHAGSLVFGENGKYISFAGDNDWALGTGDFCIEWWQYQTVASPPSYSRLFQVGDYPNHSIAVSIENGTFMLWVNNGTQFYGGVSLANYLNQWVHFAVVRQIGTSSVYQNGTRIINYSTSNDVTNNTDPLKIGFGSSNWWNGKITNFRWVKGSSVYDGTQSTITIPTSPLAAISGTKLLLLTNSNGTYLTDSSGLNKSATNNGSVTWSADAPDFPCCDTLTFVGVNANTTGNSAIKLPGGGWDGSAYSTETYTDPVSVTFQTSTSGNYLMGGFSYNPTGNPTTYLNTTYGLYIQNGFLEIYEYGGQVNVPGSISTLPTDVWKVDYDGTNVRYYQNDNLIYTSSNSVTQPLHVFFALLTGEQGVTDICVKSNVEPMNNRILFYDFSNADSYSGGGSSFYFDHYSGGSTVFDLIGNSNATLVNSPGFGVGPCGNDYLVLNGVDNYVITDTDLTPNLYPSSSSTLISVFTWVYLLGDGVIVSEQGDNTPDVTWFNSQIESISGTINFSVWPNSSVITSSIPTPFNQWHYVGFTYDGNTLRSYVNGQSAGSATFARQAPNSLGKGLYYALGYGTTTNLGGGPVFAPMRIGTFEVYNAALSDFDVLNAYNTYSSFWSCDTPNCVLVTIAGEYLVTEDKEFFEFTGGCYTVAGHRLKRHGHNKLNNRGDRYVRNTKRSFKNIFHRVAGSPYNDND